MHQSDLTRATVVAATVLAAGCARSGATETPAGAPRPAAGTVARVSGAAAHTFPHTDADVHFMTGMIAHHAQAVRMARWAPSHGASDALQRLCQRIVVGQSDEIVLMQTWLRDRKLEVPAADATRMRMRMGDMVHDMLMPGMLTDEEMAALDRARGVEFDRLFLEGMIKHHLGAVQMVDDLFAAPGAGQEEVVFRFASDVYADQTTEIERMEKMLAALPAGPRSP
jgi:uncharacterized protein (DUF305 family)